MKIAIPEHNGQVNPHFGQSRSFSIVEISDSKEIKGAETVSVLGLQHEHQGLARFLKNKGVDTVIVGGIGDGAFEGLHSFGIQVVGGAHGSIKDVIERFLRGELVSEESGYGIPDFVHQSEHHRRHQRHDGRGSHHGEYRQ